MSTAWSTPHSLQNPRSLNDARGGESQGPSRSSDGSGHARHQSQAESFASVWTGASSVRTFDVAASFPHPPSTIPLPPPSAHSQSTFRLSTQWKGTPSTRTSFLSQSPASPAFPSPFGGRRSSPHSSAHPSHEDLLSTAFIQQMLNHNSCKSTEDWHSGIVDANRMSAADSTRLPYNHDKPTAPSVHTSTESQPSPPASLGASPNTVTTFTTVRRQSTVSHDGESACHEHALVHTASMSFATRATVIGFAPMSHPNASTNAVQALYNPGNWRPLSIAPQQELDRDVLRLPAYPESVRTSHDHAAAELPPFQEVYVNGRIQSGALPSGASARFPGSIHKRHQSRTSSRSRAASITSRISKSTQGSKGKKIASAFTWLMNKSLPPLPTASQEHLAAQVHQRDIKHGRESDIPLPELARRADNLSRMLATGRLPRDSRQSNQIPGYTHEKALSRSRSTRSIFTAVSDRSRRLASGLRNGSTGNFAPLDDDQKVEVGVQAPGSFSERVSFAWTNMSRRRLFIIIILFVLILLGVVLGVVLSRKSTTATSKAAPQCTNGRAGVLCDLDATCTCTSTASGRCDSLSQSMVSLVPVVNRLFNTTISANELALVLWDLQGDPIDDCSAQAELIDVGPALTMSKYPALTQWASSALLFSLFESQDLNATDRMRTFVSANNFTSIANATNVPAASPQFTTLASGFLFDFGTMAISAPPASFKDGGQPSAEQISRVDQVAQNSLDRMYSYSTASSTQRSGALNRYWTSTLQLGTGDLNRFLSAMRNAPLMIPVDMAFSRGDDALSNHLPQDDTTSFPPPVACYPGLSNDQISIVNAVEHGAYGLPAITSAPQSFTNCPDRPIYGTLDFMRLRLPYPDSRKGLSMPGIVLDSDVAPRVVLRSGELVNALPFNGARQTNAADSNPLEYGTVSQMNHVILTWLESFPSATLAAQVVKYVISSAASSTPTNSTLFTDPTIVASIPTLEIAVFGSILPTDFTTSVAPFANADGSLFFGSSKATQFKSWALRQSSSVVAWTESASSLTVVREHKATEDAVNQALTTAARLIQSATDAGTSTGPTDVNTIISLFRQLGAFAP